VIASPQQPQKRRIDSRSRNISNFVSGSSTDGESALPNPAVVLYQLRSRDVDGNRRKVNQSSSPRIWTSGTGRPARVANPSQTFPLTRVATLPAAGGGVVQRSPGRQA
jgi:hypothetical protein